jgi:hypothetical protein
LAIEPLRELSSFNHPQGKLLNDVITNLREDSACPRMVQIGSTCAGRLTSIPGMLAIRRMPIDS